MTQKTVFIAGATGYLGRYLVEEYLSRGWNVMALVRRTNNSLPDAAQQVVAQATDPSSLEGIMNQNNIDLVVSSLGITRQKDGLSYRDVDYQANMNLLNVALKAKVPHFAYIHVLHGELLRDLGVVGVAAKQEFVDALQTESSNIRSTIICPSGFFSDMKDFLEMAQQGRVYLFGDGHHTINPIHGSDLAKASADALEQGKSQLDVGGPDVFTQTQLAELAFASLDKEPKITYLPDMIRRFLLSVVPWVTPKYIGGPAQMFLTAFALDMVGECHGTNHLADYFRQVANESKVEEQETK